MLCWKIIYICARFDINLILLYALEAFRRHVDVMLQDVL